MTTSYGDNDWVTIATFENAAEAHIVLGLLIEHDVEAILADEETTNIVPGYVYAIGGVKVRVRTRDIERANEVLNAPFE